MCEAMTTPVHLRTIPFAPGIPLTPSPYAPRSRQRLRDARSVSPSSFLEDEPSVGATEIDDAGHLIRSHNAEDFYREADDAIRLAWIGVLEEANKEEMPNEICLILNELVEKGKALLRASATHKVTRKKLRNFLEGLESERFTWGLIAAVERIPEGEGLIESRFVGEDEIMETDSRRGVERVRRLLYWLESLKRERLKASGDVEVKPLDDPAYRAEYTRKRLGKPTNIDPEKGELEDIEIKASNRLSRAVWELLRCGRHAEAQDLCCEVGQPWRAIAVGGGVAVTEISRDGVRGGARSAWREVAKTVATGAPQDIPDKYERACYGLLCGEVECVLPACADFEDCLWVRLSSLLDTALENDSDISEEEIVLAWQQSSSQFSHSSDNHFNVVEGIRRIQSVLSLGSPLKETHLLDLYENLDSLSSLACENDIEWITRLCASLVVYLELCELSSRSKPVDVFSRVLCAHCSLLIKAQNVRQEAIFNAGMIPPAAPVIYELVSSYCSYIQDHGLAWQCCADLMIGALHADMREQDERNSAKGRTSDSLSLESICDTRRLNCLTLIGKALMHRGKDFLVFLVTKAVDAVWSQLLSSEVERHEPKMSEGVSTVEMVVRSLEFLMFPEFPAYELAVKKMLFLTRKYFLEDERDIARDIVRWIPSRVVDEVRRMGGADAQDVDCWRYYMDGCEKFRVWKDYISQNRPKALPERIREQAEHEARSEVQAAAMVKLESYVREMEAFVGIAKGLRNSALHALNSILHFNGGWMKRDIQQGLRKVVVPEVVAMLQNVYGESGMYKEGLDLATVITEPVEAQKGMLYEEFSMQELQSFLRTLGHHAALLADQEIHEKGGGRQAMPYRGAFFEEIDNSDVKKSAS